MVEYRRLEPLAPCLQSRCATIAPIPHIVQNKVAYFNYTTHLQILWSVYDHRWEGRESNPFSPLSPIKGVYTAISIPRRSLFYDRLLNVKPFAIQLRRGLRRIQCLVKPSLRNALAKNNFATTSDFLGRNRYQTKTIDGVSPTHRELLRMRIPFALCHNTSASI